MPSTVDTHLRRLLTDSGRLAEAGFDWGRLDANVCAALRFRLHAPDAPPMIGLLGGASSGKSTLFNTLLDREISLVSAHAHETLGPVAAVPAKWSMRFIAPDDEGTPPLAFPELETVTIDPAQPTTGRVGALMVYVDGRSDSDRVLVDLPDVTSKMSADEGSTARVLLPWFDGLIVVVDEERWFDAAVFEETAELARNFEPAIWVVFNRTEQAGELTAEQQQRLADHAIARRAAASQIVPFQPGAGYRAIGGASKETIRGWIARPRPTGREKALQANLQRKCAAMVRENVSRTEQFAELCSRVDRELQDAAAAANLSVDLLSDDERSLLGLGRRLLPFYDVVRGLSRRLGGLGSQHRLARKVDFEKRTEELARVLQRNLEHRFERATARIDRLVGGSAYRSGDDQTWSAKWSIPPFDAMEWASRVRAHLDAWKAESKKQARRSDVAALSVGTPLLLADLLFLGGAGVTLTWAAAWVAGFVGGKSVASLLQQSPAFEDYQATVQAYRAFVRESLTDQWNAQLADMPRRHLAVTDPLMESVMYWSAPRGR